MATSPQATGKCRLNELFPPARNRCFDRRSKYEKAHSVVPWKLQGCAISGHLPTLVTLSPKQKLTSQIPRRSTVMMVQENHVRSKPSYAELKRRVFPVSLLVSVTYKTRFVREENTVVFIWNRFRWLLSSTPCSSHHCVSPSNLLPHLLFSEFYPPIHIPPLFCRFQFLPSETRWGIPHQLTNPGASPLRQLKYSSSISVQW